MRLNIERMQQNTISRGNKNNKKSRDIKQLVSLFLMERSEK